LIIEESIQTEPMAKVAKILKSAEALNLVDWNAMNIATVDFNNSPSSRMVLLKKFNDQGLVFYTNFKSKKGQDLDKNKFIAVNFWWRELKEQIRIEGEVEKLSTEKSDEYFNSRPLKSRVAAIISQQSENIDSYEILQKEIDDLTKQYERNEENPKRPEHCGLYLVKPSSIELWKEGDNRTHQRQKYVKKEDETWESSFLSP
tara:strand:+ start:40 stop:645 length:606 start_codon:yes stop_codon:yes gene_type:complete